MKLQSESGESSPILARLATPTSETTVTTPRLYLDQESKTDEVLKTFEPLKQCIYSHKHIGSSGQEEVITCDCARRIVNGVNLACNEDSDCINRLTSVECSNDCSLTCGPDCQNQRFQKRQYANITVFLTEKKGYGVRADQDIPQGTFIYEYIGEVIDEKAFRKRMYVYDQQGIKHFYFMMLQKNEFIDATKKGCLARFCNHSCNPNAYVDKWVVGKKLRMGIFAKRDIIKGEEICFDYNVDRYGATAQPCYCGEKNCIGFLGGKTQTDSASLLPQALADALRITAGEEKDWLKAKRKYDKKFKVKNNDSNINEEFIQSIVMKPLEKQDVPKVMSALMLPNQEPLIIDKLIERIYISDYQYDADDINRLLIRMHGYKTFSTIIKEVWKAGNKKTLLKMIKILLRWPAMSKNKITSSQIESTIDNISKETEVVVKQEKTEGVKKEEEDVKEEYQEHEDNDHDINQEIFDSTKELLGVWSSLQMAYRIRKANEQNGILVPTILFNRRKIDDDEENQNSKTESSNTTTNTTNNTGAPVPSLPDLRKFPKGPHGHGYGHGFGNNHGFPQGPSGFKLPIDYERDKRERDLQRLKRIEEELDRQNKILEEARRRELEKKTQSVERIIEEAKRAEEERKKKELELQLQEEKKKEARRSRSSLARRSSQNTQLSGLSKQLATKNQSNSSEKPHENGITADGKPVSSEALIKLWNKAFAMHVPNMIKKYEKQIGHENLKRCAKDIVQILSEKEITRHGVGHLPPKQLKDEKLKKVKEYTRDYMKKWLHKWSQKRSASTNAKGHRGSKSNGVNGNHKENGGHSNVALQNLQKLAQSQESTASKRNNDSTEDSRQIKRRK